MQNMTTILLPIFCLPFCWIRGLYPTITRGGEAVQARTRLAAAYQVWLLAQPQGESLLAHTLLSEHVACALSPGAYWVANPGTVGEQRPTGMQC